MGYILETNLEELINAEYSENNHPSVNDYLVSRQYQIIKHTVRHEPVKNLSDLHALPVWPEIKRVYEAIGRDDLYLTGSWFLGTYFHENDDKGVLDYREHIRKTRYSDIDFWCENGLRSELRGKVKSLQKDHKLDLISSWWGEGIRISDGFIRQCNKRPIETK